MPGNLQSPTWKNAILKRLTQHGWENLDSYELLGSHSYHANSCHLNTQAANEYACRYEPKTPINHMLVCRKNLKAMPKIFGITYTECTLGNL